MSAPIPGHTEVQELAGCPFCGEKTELYPGYRGMGAGKPYQIDCVGCGIEFTPREGMDVIAAWNRRATTSPQPTQAGLREALGDLEMARELIQSAKGTEGHKGGPVTDYLDGAENWLDHVANTLSAALSQPAPGGATLTEEDAWGEDGDQSGTHSGSRHKDNRRAKIEAALATPVAPALQNHACVEGEAFGICKRCGAPSADPIHHPIFPGDLPPVAPTEIQVETQDRKTFVVPDGYEAVRDADGRATGAIRPAAPQSVGVGGDLHSRPDFHDDPVEQLAFELAYELEDAKLSPNDYVTVNRKKLQQIATRVLSRAALRASQQAADDTECHGLDTPERVCFYEQDFYVLSNFSSFSIMWNWSDREGSARFDTSEAVYHFEKFRCRGRVPTGEQWNLMHKIRFASSAHEAFKIAERNKHLRRPDWDDVKVGIMRDILRAKAEQHEYVRRKLLATGDRELVENSWRDDFWGWGPNRGGQNMLGKLWMEVRAELRAADEKGGE